MINRNVVVLGASTKPERYANKAQVLLSEHDYSVFLVSRKVEIIHGITSVTSLVEVTEPIDTVTAYLRPELLAGVMDELIQLAPRRVIFNPGTESVELAVRLQESGIKTTEACTLVLLNTDQFED